MKEYHKHIYFLEFVFIAIPAALFMILTLSLLIGLATHVPIVALQLLPLWIGGCMGTYALWSMYFLLYHGVGALKMNDLPRMTLVCGVIANVAPVLYFIQFAQKLDQIIGSITCLIPTFVAIHWVLALTSKENKRQNLSTSESDAVATRRST